MTANFQMQRLLPSSDKVVTLEFHPELPLLATFDRRNYLTVWDYNRCEPVFECQLGTDSLYNKDTLDAVARAEGNPDYFGPKLHPYMAANYLQPSAYGRPRSLAFLDLDTICWSIATRRQLTEGALAVLPSVAHVKVLAEQRRLVVACERAVVLLDIVSKRVATIPASHPLMGGKAFTAAVVLPCDERGEAAALPRLAIASADGSIRVLNGFKPEALAVVFGSKGGAGITALTVAPIQGRDALVSGDENGNVHIWDPNLGAKSVVAPSKDGYVGPAGHLKFHKDKILSICVVPGPDPLRPKPRLVTTSACNRIGIWDLATARDTDKDAFGNAPLTGKLKLKDITVTGACALHSGVYQPGATAVLISTAGPQVYGLSIGSQEAQLVADLTPRLPPRDAKKGAKLYGVNGAALHPHIAAVASNAGVALLHSESIATLAVAGLPRVAAFRNAAGGGGDLMRMDSFTESRSASVVYVLGNRLLGASFEASEEDELQEPSAAAAPAAAGPAMTTVAMPHRVHQVARVSLAEMGTSGIPAPVRVTTHSTDGALYAAVCSTSCNEFAIVASRDASGAGKWQALAHLPGSMVEWHATEPLVGVLDKPPPGRAPPPKKGKVSKVEAEMRRRMEEANAAQASKATVSIRRVDVAGNALPLVAERLQMPPGCVATAVHGGALLGVNVKASASTTGEGGASAPLSRPSAARSEATASQAGESSALGGGGPPPPAERLLFFDWSGRLQGDGTGGLPAPKFIAYSPGGEYAALGYSDAVEVYRLAAALTLVTRVAAAHPSAALWSESALFVATDAAITAHFIVPPAPPGQRLVTQSAMAAESGSDGYPELTSLPTAATYEVQSVELATTKVSRGKALSAGGTQPELPPITLRPGSLYRLVRVTQDTLWLCSSSGHPWAMALTHAGFRCRELAMRGKLKAARQLAARALHHKHHDGLARFLSAFGADGAAEALLLPGLTLELELALAVKCGALARGVACLSALLAGCTDGTLLSSYQAWNERDINPDADELAAELRESGKGGEEGGGAEGDGMNVPGAPAPVTAENTKLPVDVIAVFKQAAGVQAPQILARLANYGVQGREEALDKDLFSSGAPAAPDPSKGKPPPPVQTYKPLFPRRDAHKDSPRAGSGGGGNDLVDPELEEEAAAADVIDWTWPLKPPPPPAPPPPPEGEEEGEGGAEAAPPPDEASKQRAASRHIKQTTLELGLRLLDATVTYADSVTLQQAIQLMAPHTGVMTASQQSRLVAAVGAAGLATQLSDLTLSGTTPILPSAAMLAGFLAGDARVTARVLEKQAFLPLKAMFMQSCGAGGVEASVQWEAALRLRMGGPTRDLSIIPQTT